MKKQEKEIEKDIPFHAAAPAGREAGPARRKRRKEKEEIRKKKKKKKKKKSVRNNPDARDAMLRARARTAGSGRCSSAGSSAATSGGGVPPR